LQQLLQQTIGHVENY